MMKFVIFINIRLFLVHSLLKWKDKSTCFMGLGDWGRKYTGNEIHEVSDQE